MDIAVFYAYVNNRLCKKRYRQLHKASEQQPQYNLPETLPVLPYINVLFLFILYNTTK